MLMVHTDDTTRKHLRGLALFTLILAGVVAAVFGLTGCNGDGRITGVVVEKDYDPPTKRNKYGDWDITVRTDDGEDVELDVTQYTYDEYQVGDRFPKNK